MKKQHMNEFNEHSFPVDVAREAGVVPALIYKLISYWIVRNQTEGRHFHDGKYWMYNSLNDFRRTLDYLTRRQIEVALEKLVDGGWIIVGHFAADKRDRTNWYTVGKCVKCISQNCEMNVTNSGNVRARVFNETIKEPIKEHSPARARGNENENENGNGKNTDQNREDVTSGDDPVFQAHDNPIPPENLYPKSPEEVMEIAASPMCATPCTRDQAEEYFLARAAVDWVDGAGRRVSPGAVVYDLRKWMLRKTQENRSPSRDMTSPEAAWRREKEANDRLWAARNGGK